MTATNTVDALRKGPATRTPTDDESIRPFRATVPDEALTDLRRRIQATRWPDKETVADPSQGPQLAKLQELVRYWGTDYDWCRAEAKLNAFPQFMTKIDGVDIHFIHVRSGHPNAMPLIIAHGWPGSVFEQIKLIGPLTDPTKYGGRAEDASISGKESGGQTGPSSLNSPRIRRPRDFTTPPSIRRSFPCASL